MCLSSFAFAFSLLLWRLPLFGRINNAPSLAISSRHHLRNEINVLQGSSKKKRGNSVQSGQRAEICITSCLGGHALAFQGDVI